MSSLFICQGIFKWRCSQCPFKSHQKNKYVRHLRVHSKSQPFSCPLCGHKTARKDYLQKHIKRFHCNVSLSLEELEKVYPDMYTIEEILGKTPQLIKVLADIPCKDVREMPALVSSLFRGINQIKELKNGFQITGGRGDVYDLNSINIPVFALSVDKISHLNIFRFKLGRI